MAVGIALMGAGIFAQTEHLPAIEACNLLTLKAVYSRSQATAEALAAKATASSDFQTYFDEPAVPGRSLADLLARADIAAVAVCMPIALQPQAIRKVLAAGKHVISEKPVAETVASARSLLAEYRQACAAATAAGTRPSVWAVAENYRYQASLHLAADKVREIGGSLVTFHLSSSKFVGPDINYFNTPWRKVPTHPGGFLLDGGIHDLAGLRTLLNAVPNSADKNRITKVTSATSQLLEILPPIDTLRAVAVTAGGASGVLTMSFGTEFGPEFKASVTTTEGRVTWRQDRVTVVRRNPQEGQPPIEVTFPCAAGLPGYPAAEANGVKPEFAAFARSVADANGVVDPRQSPEEALADLELMEAMFDSGAAGGAPREIV
ncbi:nuclear migration protein [Niveomyces insectorum RCEF 264]|uniref:Nuclear migration protein n=1 Tax=Niveomyces insectorum RCEF 264 TaxID=1081102 RepID=A0A167VQH6_9HYPO|nr:nuclear migration protein [Niveomyces insectorum RCEF 264]